MVEADRYQARLRRGNPAAVPSRRPLAAWNQASLYRRATDRAPATDSCPKVPTTVSSRHSAWYLVTGVSPWRRRS
jgi:hypothetical protein